MTTPPPPDNTLLAQDIQPFLKNQVDITSELVKQEYASTRHHIRRLRSMIQDKQAIRETICSFQHVETYPCINAWYQLHYLPPFPIALPPQVQNQGIMSPRFGWVPVHDAHEGLSRVTEWKRAAQTRQIFDCNGRVCQLIIDFQNKMNESMLAVCDIVYQESATTQSIRACQPLALLTPDIWVRAVIGYKYTSRRQFGEYLTFEIHAQGLDEQYVVDASEQAIASNPLALNNKRLIGDYGFIVTEKYRDSLILGKPWRENFTIIINVYKSGQANNIISIAVIVTIEISKQNDPRSFTSPNQMIWVRSYKEAIQKNFKENLEKLCARPDWVDSQTLKCLISPSDMY